MHNSIICMLNMLSTVVQPKTIDFPTSVKKNEKNIGHLFLSKVHTFLRNVSSYRKYAIIIYILQLLDTY